MSTVIPRWITRNGAPFLSSVLRNVHTRGCPKTSCSWLSTPPFRTLFRLERYRSRLVLLLRIRADQCHPSARP